MENDCVCGKMRKKCSQRYSFVKLLGVVGILSRRGKNY